jgi:hypothetical protein
MLHFRRANRPHVLGFLTKRMVLWSRILEKFE